MEIPFGNANLNFGESLNNPGNLSDLSNDKYALGKINNLNVYKTPEEGIAALSIALQTIQTGGARTVEEIINSFVDIVGNLVRTRTVYTNLRKQAYLEDIKNIWGIDSGEVVDINDPSTRLIMTIILTELVQKRNIYSYSQFIKGCSLAANIDTKVYEKRVNESSLSIESSKSAGYNSPTRESIVKGGSSLSNNTSSNYKQAEYHNSVISSESNSLYIKSVSYTYNDADEGSIEYSFPTTEPLNRLPDVLINLGFRQNKIISGEVVYLNENGDKARKLDNQTYQITYNDGRPDEVVKASPTTVSIDNSMDKNVGTVSNSFSLENQKTRLDSIYKTSNKSSAPVTSKPLSTAQTILAAYRFR